MAIIVSDGEGAKQKFHFPNLLLLKNILSLANMFKLPQPLNGSSIAFHDDILLLPFQIHQDLDGKHLLLGSYKIAPQTFQTDEEINEYLKTNLVS